tara:strand:- start:438 stop:626 length:189 start_codon:yes stop_codon:yes gene_type:complete
MSFYKKVNTIIDDLKDINQMYFKLQHKVITPKQKVETIPAAGVRGTSNNVANHRWPSTLRRF